MLGPMFVVLFNSVHQSVLPFHSTILRPNLIWLSTISSSFLGASSNPIDYLITFFNSIRNPKQSGASDSNPERALVGALKCCANSISSPHQGQQIHSLILKTGFSSNLFIQNSLISMYAKCGRITDAKNIFNSCEQLDFVSCNIMLSGYVKSRRLHEARQLFDIMPVRGCVAYTSMIMGLSQNNCWNEAANVFRDMRLVGVMPNDLTLAEVISSYSHLGGGIRDARMLHALTTKLRLEISVYVSTNLLHIYCISNSLGEARRLFDEMHEKSIVSWNVMLNGYSKAGLIESAKDLFESIPEKDVVSWGTIIDACVQADRLIEALMLYRLMLHKGLGPNDVMIVDLISACARVVGFSEGQQLHATIAKTGFDCFDFVQSTIIHFYAACNKIDLACRQFESASKDHITSWNALIAGFVRNDMVTEARQVFDEMPERDIFSWSTMISGCSRCGQPEMALELFHKMVAASSSEEQQPNEITMVSVLSAIASLGKLDKGIRAHEYLRRSSIPLNDNLSAALIDMYAKCGSIDTSFAIFSQLRGRVTSISPWNAIICGLAMHGHADLSLAMFTDLQRFKIKPNSITFIGVLTACCHAGLVEAGRRHFESMRSIYNIEPNIKHYGCMIDLFGRAGRLEEAEEMIRSMPMEADVVIWGTLLAACKIQGNIDIGKRAAERLARLDMSHGASRILLSSLYADAGMWSDSIQERIVVRDQKMTRLPGCSGVV